MEPGKDRMKRGIEANRNATHKSEIYRGNFDREGQMHARGTPSRYGTGDRMNELSCGRNYWKLQKLQSTLRIGRFLHDASGEYCR